MNNKFWKIVVLGIAVIGIISGCATSPIPEGYVGPIATIRDSAIFESSNRSQIFYLSELNGNRMENALGATRKANQGRGFSLSTIAFSREVPAKTITVSLAGRVEYGAPIQAIANMSTTYTATKSMTFTPSSNKTYVVRGQLTATNQEVWLEDAETGQRID